jgi:hypothetical protein
MPGGFAHPDGFFAVAAGGNAVYFATSGGAHQDDLWVTTRGSSGWSNPVLLTRASPYKYNEFPSLSADGKHLLFDAGNQADLLDGPGTTICEVDTNGQNFHLILDPAKTTGEPKNGSLHSPSFAPDGSIVFQGNWGSSQIYRLNPGTTTPVVINANQSHDGAPVVLPDGRVVSLWEDRVGNTQGLNEIKIMAADGSSYQMPLTGKDVNVFGMGTGGIYHFNNVQFGAASYSVKETAGSITITVTRSGDVSEAATVHYATSNGTAKAGTDYLAASGDLTYAANQTTASFTVSVVNVNKPGVDKTVNLTLSNPNGATLGKTSAAVLTIVVTNHLPTVAFQNTAGSGAVTVANPVITVAMSTKVAYPVSVNYVVTGGTATRGQDYSLAAGTLVFDAGVATEQIPLTILNPKLIEPNQTVVISLDVPQNCIVGTPSSYTYTILEDNTDPTSGFRVLLTPAMVASLQAAAKANSPQWQAFKARLDSELNNVIADDIGSYQGQHLEWIADYALGYQVLKNSDPLTAANYADKAIALLKSGLYDYQKGSWVGMQLLARGDGTTTSFVLPNSDLLPSTLQVSLSPVTVDRVVHGSSHGQDAVGDYQQFLNVSNTSDGPASYAKNVDWRYNPDYAENLIDWSLSGKQPAAGAAYYVTVTSPLSAGRTRAFTLNGHTITFAKAPTAGQAVWVQYVYGTHSADGSTLAYQQTSEGDGGFNSIFIDDDYSARYLGYLGIGMDWLDGYAGFKSGLETQVENMLARWSSYLKDSGYVANYPQSNMADGGYFLRTISALALSGRDSRSDQLMADVLAYRKQYVVPMFTKPTNSLAGGYWDEGWNYGYNAAQDVLVSALALAQGRRILDTVEGQWCNQVIEDLVSAQSSTTNLYDGGEWYMYPTKFLDKGLLYDLSHMATSASDRSYANYILQNYPAAAFGTPGDTADYRDVLFHNPKAPASYWSALPLQDYASGQGLLTARSDWGSQPVWWSTQFNNVLLQSDGQTLAADHQNYAPGHMEIARGKDQLLINALAATRESGDLGIDDYGSSQYMNTVAIDDQGAGMQRDPYSMGLWYGSPGVVTRAYEGTADHVFISGDYRAAYSPQTSPGTGGPASQLTREVVYLRPGLILVYDRVATTSASYPKQLRWNFPNAPVVAGDAFTETVGSSVLFGQTFSSVALATTVSAVNIENDVTVQRLITQPAGQVQSVRFVTAFQVGDAKATRLSSQRLVSTDNRMEGVQAGNDVVLFGRDGAVDPATAVTYRVNASGTVHHFLVDLKAGQSYQITDNGAVAANLKASAQGTLSFDTTGTGQQTIVVGKPASQHPDSAQHSDSKNSAGVHAGLVVAPRADNPVRAAALDATAQLFGTASFWAADLPENRELDHHMLTELVRHTAARAHGKSPLEETMWNIE